MPSTLRTAVLVLSALWCSYPLLPSGTPREIAYDAFAVACILVGLAGARRVREPMRRSWVLILAGFGTWVAGDVVFSIEQFVMGSPMYPAPSDALYLAAYVVLGAGLLRLVRGRQNRTDPTPLLDAAIVAVGFGIVVGTFFVAPIAADSSLTVLGRVVASAYPVVDVLLIGVLVRLWATVGARTAAFRLLFAALLSTLAADLAWNALALADPRAVDPAWLDLLWLFGYLGAAAAATSSTASDLGDGTGPAEVGTTPHRRLAALGCGLVLPGVVLLLNGLLGREVPWALASVGSVGLSALILVRMGLLVRTVEVQAVQLAALARSDSLTGAPNRRTWDLELGRAVQQSEETGAQLSVALIDLDHFKGYNDTHGHQAGDLLLREAVAAWSDLLRPGELLARYGGEEFGLLLPGSDVDQTARRLEQMLALTPRGQRFSSGVAAWTPGSDPAGVVELADRALYDAKHAGRGCVRIAPTSSRSTPPPAVRIALQPIVDLDGGSPVGHEALSRFSDANPEVVFAEAHRAGYGPALEAAAILAALQHRPAEGYLSVNLSVEALVSDDVRAVLPDDLHGITIEITEQTDGASWEAVNAVIADWRARGASIAIDDWGRGFSNVERIMRLRPDVVKLDRSLLADLEELSRQEAVRTLVDWARSLGAAVCAEGIETAEQWHILRRLGVEFGQGYHFGRPVVGPLAPAVREAEAPRAR